MKMKMTLYRANGDIAGRLLIEQERLEPEVASLEVNQIAHHIILIDRSRSMASSLQELHHRLHKLLVLEEFKDASVKVSLLSYAAQGDLVTHCEREPLERLMSRGDERLEALKAYMGGGETCISQALERALELIDPAELTSISLHSDGFASDPSYAQERARLRELVGELSHSQPRASLHTIAHAKESDFNLLSELAQLGRGRCVLAEDVRAVYQALHHTTALIAQPQASAYQVTHQGLWALYTKHDRLFSCGVGPALVEGFGAASTRIALRFTALDEEAFESLSAPLIDGSSAKGRELVVALSRAALGVGRLNLAKYALITSASAPLLREHLRALSAYELGRLRHGLEEALFGRELTTHPTLKLSELPQLPSVLEVMSALHQRRDAVMVDREALLTEYEARQLPRCSASEGEVSPSASSELSLEPPIKYKPRSLHKRYVPLAYARLNHSTASLNLTISEPVELIPVEPVEPAESAEPAEPVEPAEPADAQPKPPVEALREVEGVSLEGLSAHRSYSVVADGRLHLAKLSLLISSEALWAELKALGVVEGDYRDLERSSRERGAPCELDLSALPLVSDEALEKASFVRGEVSSGAAHHLDGLFETLARARFLRSALNAILKGSYEALSLPQVKALAALGVSPSLSLTQPTLKVDEVRVAELREQGRLTRSLRHVIELGDHAHVSLTRLPSANAYFQAQYVVRVEGERIERPQLSVLLSRLEGRELAEGSLEVIDNPNTRDTPTQRLLKPVLKALLGEREGLDVVRGCLRALPLEEPVVTALCARLEGGAQGAERSLYELRDALDLAIEQRYLLDLSPVVFSLACSGLIPSALSGELVSAEELKAERPQLNLTNHDERATFLKVGERALLCVSTEATLTVSPSL